MKNYIRWTLAILGLVAILAPTVAMAEEDAAVSGGDIVRRKLLYRSTRFEVAPQINFTLADSFRRNMLVGAGIAYHLTNEWSFQASANYGVLQLETDLSKNLGTTLNAAQLQDVSYSYIQLQGDVGLAYVPIFGKFSVLSSTSLSYDFHVSAGVAFVNEKAEAAVANGNIDQSLEGFRPGGYLQFGVRLFIGDGMSLTVDLKNLLYNRVEISRGSATPEFQDTVTLGVGLSFFLPGEVKISR
ncbi:MAG: outer membrane beta-barrel domain-containing protein [bacterium]